MKKKLYIHIGTGKTGTTAIQDFMLINQDNLESNGILYCKTGRTGNNHHLLCQNFKRTDKVTQNTILNNLILLNQEILESACHKFIISSEYFPGLTLEEIKSFCSMFDVAVIPLVYLRRQDEYIESWYAQVVKAYHVNYSVYELKDELYRANILNYLELIENWEKASECVIVRVYEKESFYKGNIFDDFLFALDINFDSEYTLPTRKSNLSILRNQIQLKKALASISTETEQRILSQPISIDNFDEKYFMSPSSRESILDEFRPMNEQIAKKYLGRKALFINEKVDSNWSDVDSEQYTYIDLFLKKIKAEKPEVYDATQDLFFRFCMIKYDEFNVVDKYKAQKYIDIATHIRPDSKLIKLKYKLNKNS
ncbi:hypothetical protein [Pseudoalteromonas distincta]|uniref:hypothetical protein n=1 Tax=Pseudoalteromonas distincta TaxID=77608 RepID=UPI002431C22B|nr:hypothetical protein [Pseudoalteromonas distincta]